MPRPKALVSYALVVLGLVALFVVFIAFRRDAALIAALEAAGAVAAAGFAAIAAMGAMRAAAESSASAKRSREAFARTVRPRVQPSISQQNGTVLATVEPGDGHPAVDVTAVWVLADRAPITDQTPRLDQPLPVALEVPEGTNIWDKLETVWIEYSDDARTGQWRDTWQAISEGKRFALTHSELVD